MVTGSGSGIGRAIVDRPHGDGWSVLGVDLKAALDVLNGGLAGSTVLTRKKDNFLARDFKPGFRIDLHHKDMGIVTDAARNVGAALPVGAVVAQLVASLRAQGDGGLDHSALLRAVERLSGAQL